MQHFKKIGSKIIWPGLAVMALLAAVSAALLCYTVLCGEKDTIISYLAYIVSTYTLIVVVCRIIKTLKEAKRAVYAIDIKHGISRCGHPNGEGRQRISLSGYADLHSGSFGIVPADGYADRIWRRLPFC